MKNFLRNLDKLTIGGYWAFDSFKLINIMDYKGDVEPQEAYDTLREDENSYLIDVRTLPEWSFVGLPDLSGIGKQVICISWLLYPHMAVNQEFLGQLEKEIGNKNAKLFFMCKVGGRSLDAAIFAQNSGFQNCFNVSGGFEGNPDKNGHRGTVNGWKAQGLPWEQS